MRVWTAEDYGGAPSVGPLMQHPFSGFIYMGSGAPILEFDGVRWRGFGPRDGTVSALAVDAQGRIWYATGGDVGWLEADARGELQPVSVAPRLPSAERSARGRRLGGFGGGILARGFSRRRAFSSRSRACSRASSALLRRNSSVRTATIPSSRSARRCSVRVRQRTRPTTAPARASRPGNDREAVTTIGEELAMLRSYLDIEKIRLGELLQLEIASDPAAEHVRIPPFLLLPLVENAVKYGTATSVEHVGIRLTVHGEGDEGLAIEVANTGAWLEPGTHSTVASAGIGLQTCGNGSPDRLRFTAELRLEFPDPADRRRRHAQHHRHVLAFVERAGLPGLERRHGADE